MRMRPIALAVPASLLLLWGCGSDGDTTSAPSAAPTEEAAEDDAATDGTDDSGEGSTFADGLDADDDAMDAMVGETGADAAEYEDYEQVTDDLGDLRMEVPTAFGDLDTAPLDGRPAILASSDLDAYRAGWEVGALIYFATDEYELSSGEYFDRVQAANAEDPSTVASECDEGGVERFEETAADATIQLWEDCGGTDTQYVIAYLAPATPDVPVLVLEAQIADDADVEAFSRALDSLGWQPEL